MEWRSGCDVNRKMKRYHKILSRVHDRKSPSGKEVYCDLIFKLFNIVNRLPLQVLHFIFNVDEAMVGS